MTKVYFAAPLFSQADFNYNASLVAEIRKTYPDIDVFLPQEQGEINDKDKYADSKMIAQWDAQAVAESDILIALLDGVSIDAGVASEVGIAYQAGTPILGLFTDSRQQGANNPDKIKALSQVGESQFAYINLFTVGLTKLRGQVLSHPDDLIKALGDLIEGLAND